MAGFAANKNDTTNFCSRHNIECLFGDTISQTIKDKLKQQGTYDKSITKYIELLEANLKDDEQYFWKESGRSNLLVFLYMEKNLSDAQRQSEISLKHFPTNITSLVGHVKICHLRRNSKAANSKLSSLKEMECLENQSTFEKEKLISAGEVAYAFTFMGPAFYIDAIKRYEDLFRNYEALRETITDDHKAELDIKALSWHFHLAQTYNRMMSKGRRDTLHARGYQLKDVYERIRMHLTTVIDSKDQFYAGKAMIEMVDAFKTYETCWQEDIEFPLGDPDAYVLEAIKQFPNDPYVLEKGGRHYRQRATNKAQLREVINIFETLLEKYPSRHVGWHHKGLAYRSLWLDVGGFVEARLHTNDAKKGNKKRTSHRHSGHHFSSSTSYSSKAHRKSTTDAHESVKTTTTAGRPELHLNLSVSSEAGTREMAAAHDDIPQSAPASLPSLKPKFPSQQGKCPKQPKKPDYYDVLRTSNPVAKAAPSESTEYLKQAQECFKKANEITKQTHCRYLVDLARTCVSLQAYDEADALFSEAHHQLLQCSDENDMSYLYEQWAMLRHFRQKQDGDGDNIDDEDLCDIMGFYRESLLASIRGRIKSRIALYGLRDLLKERIDKFGSNDVLQLEYDILNNSTELYSKDSKEHNQLVQAIRVNETLRERAWEMIDYLHKRQHKKDAAKAFMYLTAINEAQPFCDPNNCECGPEVVLEITRRSIEEENGGMTKTISDLGEVFAWFIGTKTFSERGLPHNLINVDPCDKYDICILSPCDVSPGTQKLISVLRKDCNLKICKVFVDNTVQDIDVVCDDESLETERELFDDRMPGHSVLEEIHRLVACSKSLVVLEDSASRHWNALCPVLEQVLKIPESERFVCRVEAQGEDWEVDNSGTAGHIKAFPILILHKECSSKCIAYSLFKTMLVKQVQSIPVLSSQVACLHI